MSKPTSQLARKSTEVVEGLKSDFIKAKSLVPNIGKAGSYSTAVYDDSVPYALDSKQEHTPWNRNYRFLYVLSIVLGGLGSTLTALAGLGAGVYPVVNHRQDSIPIISLLMRAPFASIVCCFIGIGMLCIGWILLSTLVIIASPTLSLMRKNSRLTSALAGQPSLLQVRSVVRIWLMWTIPLLFTAPLFSKDVYSYLAQGKIADSGIDPYSQGPSDILGLDDPLARSVPLLWSHSPAPYGPLAMWYSGKVYSLSGENVYLGVFLHRIVGLVGIGLAIWAIYRLSQRFEITPVTALFFSVLNPLTLLHLTAGAHNEAILLGLMLVGLELCFRGARREQFFSGSYILYILGIVFICAAGTIKVTAFLALGFAGVALARATGGHLKNLALSATFTSLISVCVVVALSYLTGFGFGWITGQGGAADVLSVLSITTDTGILSSFVGELLGLGDHTSTALRVCRVLGLCVGAFWIIRMLWASFKGRISPLAGLGLATLMMIIFFPVVHVWYALWALYPLAASVNSRFLRRPALFITVFLSFMLQPRPLSGSGLTITQVVILTIAFIILICFTVWQILLKNMQPSNSALPSNCA